MTTTMDSTIKNWYLNKYPEDVEVGSKIGYEVTFNDLNDNIDEAYGVLGVCDSIVRERCFSEISRLLNVEYKVIYEKWLNVN